MTKFSSIQEAAKYMGVSVQTLRRWEKKKKIAPSFRTEGNQRRYDPSMLRPFENLFKINNLQLTPQQKKAQVRSSTYR